MPGVERAKRICRTHCGQWGGRVYIGLSFHAGERASIQGISVGALKCGQARAEEPLLFRKPGSSTRLRSTGIECLHFAIVLVQPIPLGPRLRRDEVAPTASAMRIRGPGAFVRAEKSTTARGLSMKYAIALLSLLSLADTASAGEGCRRSRPNNFLGALFGNMAASGLAFSKKPPKVKH
jgi:hypothetical protein